jgi:murein DD-endopeptidase MepM/ murein hydrolase activator NlpD
MRPIRDTAEGARTLETILLKQLITDSGMFRGMNQSGGKIYGEMFCEALANAVSQGGGVGIAKLVQGSFEKAAGGAPDGASEGNPSKRMAQPPARNLTAPRSSVSPLTPEVSSTFGERTDPIDGSHRFHTGIDVAAQEGSPILAAASGIVRRAGWRGGYGRAVEIDNGKGVSTLYGHAQALAVKEGDQVKAGEPIALVGHSGRATGSHLHFEVRKDGKPTDPQSTLNRWQQRADSLIGRKP